MFFSAWQVARLRRRLAAYRLNSAYDGKPMPWIEVARVILESEATSLDLPEADEDPMTEHESLDADIKRPDKNWPLKGENLRKFVEGEPTGETGQWRQTVLSSYRLKAVYEFLVDEKYISKRDMRRDPPAYHAAYDLLDYFFEDHGRTYEGLNQNVARTIAGDYVCVHITDKAIRESRLSIEFSGDRSVLIVKETRKTYTNTGTIPYRLWKAREKKAFLERTHELSGWGVCMDLRGLTALFLKNADDGLNAQCYIVTVIPPRGEKSQTALAVLRGPLTRIPATYDVVEEGLVKVSPNATEIWRNDFLMYEATIY